MQQISTFSQMIEHLRQTGLRKRVAVVCPYDEETIAAATRAHSEGLADLIMLGDSRLATVLPESLATAPGVEVVTIEDADEAARTAVNMVHQGTADILMKGLINTDNFLRAILNKENGLLPKGRLLTHLSVAQLPTYKKLLFFSDVAVIPYPTIDQRVEIISYDLDTCRKLGISQPKVALIHFTEKVNPKFPNSTDYVKLIEMADAGRFGDVKMGGPMDVKTACDSHSAEVKGLTSDVCGDADLLIFPNIESGNTFYKTITLFGNAVIAGILQGPSCPVILSSRSDSAESKFLSMALACINA
ncbi:MAG: phosphate butyryltransferase [Muribaculaceae bacterium]|nr:phosphate butyryltransferase [Muribaculaceae bacterium]